MNQDDVTRQVNRLVHGHGDDPFATLGRHMVGDRVVVRCLWPRAEHVVLIGPDGTHLADMSRVHDEGAFEGELPSWCDYRLRATDARGRVAEQHDAYRFGTPLSDLDLHLIGEGTHEYLYRKLGANVCVMDGVRGVHFAVWAPNAQRVSVVGSFNGWDGRRHVMRRHHEAGVWDIFVPEIDAGEPYKYELIAADGHKLPLKADPMGRFAEPPPGNASRVENSDHRWRDHDWMKGPRATANQPDAPISIYEVHLGSWKRHADGTPLDYDELANELVEYAADMGFTHLELMPIHEHPFDGSWGYQPIGLYAPTCRFGPPDACRRLIDRAHQRGLAVIIDWVAAHFPRDAHGLAEFDGTCLYEHADPKRGAHMDWGTLIFNLSRREVANYLIANALYWVREFHVDALRVDAVASMLYLDYSREDGEWIPNEHGGNENLEAIEFFAELNARVSAAGGTTMAEESTAWPMVSRPVSEGGLGFDYKWNLGWMHDTLAYLSEDPLARKHHHDKMTFGLVYAFSENFILPLSHDEVVHGKRSLLGRIPGDLPARLATLRAYFAFMFAHPGKKLLFMGAELAQHTEWAYQGELDWALLDAPDHRQTQAAVRALNGLYRQCPALHAGDAHEASFEWLVAEDRDHSVFAFVRTFGADEMILCVSNFTPIARSQYRIGLPRDGAFSLLFDSSNVGTDTDIEQAKLLDSAPIPSDGRTRSITVDLPALTTLYLRWHAD
ncbi:MAG: 1,4-alpha-glucan branching protein GlgB [Pseudomonadota bacterium]